MQKQMGLEEEIFSLLKGDAIIELFKGVAYLTFSNRVYEYIKKRMARMIVVKLLGGQIGFNAFLNKITMIWNPQGNFQLMDLEN